jgi:uncharacterized membrane protein YjgN (DUF898 family)
MPDFPNSAVSADPAAVAAPLAAEPLHRPAPVYFTGSGSEYFRIWIVNLFLTYISLGLYSAWAKVRREKYFHQNTHIAGHSLDYHGQPFAILKGRLVGLALFGLYTGSSAVPSIGLLAIVGMVLLLPFLMQRSIRFRLANSSYRGIRFGFTADAKTAYRVLAPYLAIPLTVAGAVLLAYWYPDTLKDTWNALPQGLTIALGIFGVLLALGGFALFAMFHAVWRRFTINHLSYGMVMAQTTITNRGYAWIYVSTVLGMVALLAGVGIAVALSEVIAIKAISATFALLTPFLLLAFMVSLFSIQAVLTVRLQNYCWNTATGFRSANEHQLAWFTSTLSARSYAWLQIKNWILIGLTLGLYRPFAVVRSTKARLAALSLSSDRFIDFVTGEAQQNASAIGDEALDAFGLDFSL